MSNRRSKGCQSTMFLVLFTRARVQPIGQVDRPAKIAASAALPGHSMTDVPATAMTFTPAERDYIRRELDMFFSTFPTVAEGFQLKTWRGGPQAGQPKLPPAAKGLLERGLMRLDATSRIAPAVLHRPGIGRIAGDDGGPAARKPGEVRPCQAGARPRRLSAG